MPEEEKLFYGIGEVSQIVDVKPYVLRYWETEFRKAQSPKVGHGPKSLSSKGFADCTYNQASSLSGAVYHSGSH